MHEVFSGRERRAGGPLPPRRQGGGVTFASAAAYYYWSAQRDESITGSESLLCSTFPGPVTVTLLHFLFVPGPGWIGSSFGLQDGLGEDVKTQIAPAVYPPVPRPCWGGAFTHDPPLFVPRKSLMYHDPLDQKSPCRKHIGPHQQRQRLSLGASGLLRGCSSWFVGGSSVVHLHEDCG
jgi:hypothetical protein